MKYSGGRIDTAAYLREVHREKGEIGSVYDSNVTAPDPFPFSPRQQSSDPILEAAIAPTTTAMVDWVTRVVGWKTTARYNALSYEVAEQWNRDRVLERGAKPLQAPNAPTFRETFGRLTICSTFR